MISRVYYLCILLLSIQFMSNAMEPRKSGIVTVSQLGDEIKQAMLNRIKEGNVANAAILENCCIKYMEDYLNAHGCTQQTVSFCINARHYLRQQYSQYISPSQVSTTANIQDYSFGFSNGNMRAVYLVGGDAGTVTIVKKDEQMRWHGTDIIRLVPGVFVRYACVVDPLPTKQDSKEECVAIEGWKKGAPGATVCLYDKLFDKDAHSWKKRAEEINLTENVFAYGFSPGGSRAAVIVKARNARRQSIVVYDLVDGKYIVRVRKELERDAKAIIWQNQEDFLIRMGFKLCMKASFKNDQLTIAAPISICTIKIFALSMIVGNVFKPKRPNKDKIITITNPIGAIANRLYKTMVVAQSKDVKQHENKPQENGIIQQNSEDGLSEGKPQEKIQDSVNENAPQEGQPEDVIVAVNENKEGSRAAMKGCFNGYVKDKPGSLSMTMRYLDSVESAGEL